MFATLLTAARKRTLPEAALGPIASFWLPADHFRSTPNDRTSSMPRATSQKGYNRKQLFHSITSSARPNRGSGIVMPSAFADFPLMNNSSLVPCWTGRSAGFSPLEDASDVRAR